MTLFSHKQSKTGNMIVRMMLLLWVLISIGVSGSLVSEGRYYPAPGWGIITIVFILFFILTFIKPRETKISNVGPFQQCGETLTYGDDELVLLYSSKDIVRISQIEQALQMRGIDFTVLDRHEAAMMAFLPEVEIRIMVPKRDLEWGRMIIKELLAQDTNK